MLKSSKLYFTNIRNKAIVIISVGMLNFPYLFVSFKAQNRIYEESLFTFFGGIVN